MTSAQEKAEQVKLLLEMTPQDMRKMFKVQRTQLDSKLKPTDFEQPAKIIDSSFKGPESDIPIRVYTPEGSGPFPAIVFYHGGGWIFGDIPGYDSFCRAMCVATEAVVISVDYRLASEFKFPAAVHDTYGALVHCYENPETYNIDRNRVAVAGDSAGGNLAAVTTLMIREHRGPAIKFQCLIYPAVDIPRFFTEAYVDSPMLPYFADAYLNSREEAANIYVSPLKADLTGLPPCFLLTCQSDPLLEEGKDYVKKLQESGVPCEYYNVDGLDHGFVDVNKHRDPKVAPHQDAVFAALKKGLQ
ncbi:Alpha/Beta hydrolase protein [Umbelopsis sp. AD052]|nr:Alpha/Beta hydrolase protein [Umbelopsis sp. AD052]